MGLTLREGNREYFYQQLDRQFPGLKAQYIRRYGSQYQIPSPRQRELMLLFYRACSAYGIETRMERLWEYLSQFEDKSQGRQMNLFESF